MRRILYREGADAIGSAGLLVLRLVVGAAFLLHGWPKIQNPMGWMPKEAPVPGLLQAAAAVSEFGGGIALMLGVLTPLGCLGLAATMAFAITMVHMKSGHPFVDAKGGPSYELAAAYLACVIMLLLTGPGRFSLDAVLFGRPRGAAEGTKGVWTWRSDRDRGIEGGRPTARWCLAPTDSQIGFGRRAGRRMPAPLRAQQRGRGTTDRPASWTIRGATATIRGRRPRDSG